MSARAVQSGLLKNITQDHSEIRTYYKEYSKLRSELNFSEAKKWYNQFAWEVARHSAAEEIVLYPFLEQQQRYDVQKNIDQHQEVKQKLAQIESMDIQEKEFDNIVQSIMKSLEEHMKLEEADELPDLEKAISVDILDDLGNCNFFSFYPFFKFIPYVFYFNYFFSLVFLSNILKKITILLLRSFFYP